MDLTVIIVNWNAKALLANCLRSLRSHADGLRLQIILVDNCSSDGSQEMITSCFPEVDLVNSGANLGFARANNLVLDRVRSDLVLFLNPDTEVRPGALCRIRDVMLGDPGIGAVSCKTFDSSGAIQELGVQRFPTPMTELVKLLFFSNRTRRALTWWLPRQDPEKSGFVEKLFGACLLVRRAVLNQVGSFDEQFFMYCEDVDLSQRIRAAGWKLYYDAEAEIMHVCGSSSSRATGEFSVLMMCESFWQLMRKHHGAVGSAGYRAAVLTGALFRCLLLVPATGISVLRGDSRAQNSLRKYATMVQWSLGVRRPVVADVPQGNPPITSGRLSMLKETHE
jgi:GT2 family glycosyltransferase